MVVKMETPKVTANEYASLLRQSLYAFIARTFYELNPDTEFRSNWHIEVIAAELEACWRGETKRLIINVPPRSLKSQAASVAFPAWLGQNPSAQIICASYAQDLANKHAMDCRTVLASTFYRSIFPTRLSSQRNAVQEFMTTQKGVRLATSLGGMLTGRGADFIIIDDPLKPDEALSETQRNAANNWFDNTLYSRLNDKNTGCIILIMQRLHEDDLVGHVLNQTGKWKVLRFPAIAEEDESYSIQTILRRRHFQRRAGEALHPERESLEVLQIIREIQGEYNFAGQYQQAPAPLGGGMIKAGWFKTYNENQLPPKFDLIFQSWDTANKPTQLSDYSVCTTWGVKEKHIYLLHVLRRRMDYPALKRAVAEQSTAFRAKEIIIEDKASGTQLIQELIHEGVHGIKRYEPKMDKVMRMHTVSSTIENGFVHLPEKAEWLAEYLHEITTFPKGKHDDQVDSSSQALDWVRQGYWGPGMGIFNYYRQVYEKQVAQRGGT
jgi:predicted phage terminase large subunit-like protein